MAEQAKVGRDATQKDLNRLLAKWVRRLDLNPPLWKAISIAFGAEENRPEVDAIIMWETEHSSAEILLATPAHARENFGSPMTVERAEEAIVHELLHLRLEGHQRMRTQRYDAMYERALNTISRALLTKK